MNQTGVEEQTEEVKTDNNPNRRGLFIGGIPREISEPSFIKFLEEKVEVLEFKLKQRQLKHGMCAGYGVLWTTEEGFNKIISSPIMKYNSAILSCNPYLENKTKLKSYLSEFNSRKITIIGDCFDLSQEEAQDCFQKFGVIENISIFKNQ